MTRSFRTDYLTTSPATFAPLIGNPTRFGALTIDGAINLIDTNIALFTAIANLREVKVLCVNRSNQLSKIRVAHIDGAIGAIASEDYIFYDVDLLPNETKVVNIDGMAATDTVLVRSTIVDVGFMADGQTMSADYGYRRLAAATVLADTPTALHLTTGATENITVVACNKDPLISAYVRIAIIDAAVIGSLAVEDYIVFDDLIQPTESKTYNLELDMPVNNLIGVQSTDADTNFLMYGRLQ